jgi:hypothetical protein
MRASRGMGPILPSKRPKANVNTPAAGSPVPGIKKGGRLKAREQKAKR